jgi:DNA-binding Lrp family transcriptional regulator
MSPGRHAILTTTQLRILREWQAKPRGERQPLRELAEFLRISYSTAKRGAAGKDYYAKVLP